MALKIRPIRNAQPGYPTIRITEFESRAGPLSKTIWQDDETFKKSGKTTLSNGFYRVRELPFAGDPVATLTALGERLKELTSHQAISLGHYANANITEGFITSKKLAGPDDATRTKSDFPGETGFALLLLDGDGVSGLADRLPDLWPGFAQVATLTRPSASAGVYNPRTGATMPGGGEHVYLVISDGSKGRDVLMAIHRLCWMQGHGRLERARDGRTLERSLVDTAVWVPSRLIYEGAIILEPPLAQHPRDVVIRLGGVLDVACFLAFAAKEAPEARVRDLIRKAESEPTFKAEQQRQRRAFLDNDIARRMARGASRAEAERAAKLSCKAEGAESKGTLTGSTIFVTRDGEDITVSDILIHPEKHAGKTGFDPIEGPDYGSATVAMIMGPGFDGKPCIFSYAHGEGRYRLVHDRASLDKALDENAFGAHADLIAAMVDADLDEPDRHALHHRAAAVFPDVKFRVSQTAFTQAKRKAERERRETDAEREERITLRYDPENPAAMADAIEDAFAAMNPPVLYTHGGRLAAVTGRPVEAGADPHGIVDASGQHRLSILSLNRPQLAYYVSERIAFMAVAEDRIKFIAAPNEVLDVCLHLPADRRKVPQLTAIRSTPPVSDGGDVRTTPGLIDGILYDGSVGAITVPAKPMRRDARRAWAKVLRTVFREFPFATRRDHAVLLALIITLMTRHEYDTAPAFVINAPLPSTGKSLLAEIAILLVTATRASAVGYDNADAQEVRKLLTTYIASGAQAILFDNVEGEIGNPHLNRALTAAVWGDRILATNTSFEGPQTTTFVFTSNGAVITGDARRRFLRLNLFARGWESPGQRPIRNRRLAATVMTNRADLMSALLTIIRAHRQAGMPGRCVLASFDGWALRVGRLVEWLTDHDSVSVQAALADDDPKELAARAIYAAWENWFGSESRSAAMAHYEWKCDPRDHPPEYVSNELRELHDALRRLCGERMTKVAFSRMLSGFVDRQINGRVFQKRSDAKNNKLYAISAARGAAPVGPPGTRETDTINAPRHTKEY